MQTSCGFGVPYLTSTLIATGSEEKQETTKPILKDRETLGHWASKKIETNTLQAYQAQNNAGSLDGLTGLRAARRERGERFLLTEAKASYRRILGQREALLWGLATGMVMMFLLMATISDSMGWGPSGPVHIQGDSSRIFGRE